MKNNIYIFTDASSFNNGRQNPNEKMVCCASMVVKYADGNLITSCSRVIEDGTNNRGESYALLMALRYANDNYNDISVTIITDSKLCFMSVTEWANTWETKKTEYSDDWINSSGTPVINQDILKECFGIYNANCNIKLLHIRGHIYTASKRKAALKTFNKLNGYDPSEAEFTFLKQGNDDVDELAGKVLTSILPRLYDPYIERSV